MRPIVRLLGGRVQATHLLQNRFLNIVVTANHTVNVLVLWGVEIKNIHNFDETWRTVPLWYKKK